ncbi:serine/threonine protein kinase [Singulisphaera sp. GP187]|uniref:protein kinase domain-containing protein n=1 Tax=Singulisphaera sp. GP187 TaxID=1882752 RepID=UPI00092B500F|nr:protein kinase [Singulisphaera sp. GP187]SIN77006.1 serine/threonine protein kinase [Singulisphaera sp. GP187]
MNPADPTAHSALPLSQFRRMIEVCDRFEGLLRAGKTPSLEEFLGETSGEERDALHTELAALLEHYGQGAATGQAPVNDLTIRSKTLAPPTSGPQTPPGADDLEILEEIGRGGMGVVYRARQVKLDRIVALKMILAESHANPKSLARFRTEAQAVARLSHPNFVQIYEIGERDGFPYFSMEFVEGGSLARKLGGGPLPVRQAAQIIETLARATHVAHERGIVHRDIKPANILLTHSGEPKITDFGLAKIVTGVGSVNPSRSETLVGTPAYMAPEQAQGDGHELGPLADVYALGATLYEMLTGLPPFQAATALETLLLSLNQDPVPPGRLRTKLPRDIETICLKCLEKEPKRRYPSAEALADDLHAFLGGEPIAAQPAGRLERAVRWSRRQPARAVLVASGTVATVGLLVGLLASNALVVSAVAVLGLLAGGSWHHARLQSALRELAQQQLAAERHAERLHLLGEMTRRLMTITDADKLLFLLGETACRVANAELATIYLIDRDRGELWSKLTIDSTVGEIRVPLGVGIAGTVAVTGETIRIPDAYADPRFNPEIDKRSGYRTRNLLTFPMTGQNGCILGVFQVLNKRGGDFEVVDEEVLASLAASAAVAVEHARRPPPAKGPLSETIDDSDVETLTLTLPPNEGGPQAP